MQLLHSILCLKSHLNKIQVTVFLLKFSFLKEFITRYSNQIRVKVIWFICNWRNIYISNWTIFYFVLLSFWQWFLPSWKRFLPFSAAMSSCFPIGRYVEPTLSLKCRVRALAAAQGLLFWPREVVFFSFLGVLCLIRGIWCEFLSIRCLKNYYVIVIVYSPV